MIRRLRRVGLLAAVLAATAALLYTPISGSAESSRPIDLNGQTDSAQCAPCHLRIAEGRKPGLIFGHGNHLVVTCSACHLGPPHQGGRTMTPPMEVCFDCHGIPHGPQGPLATAACSACHTPSFPLRPASHSPDWAGKPHADVGKKGVNSCMMCHNAPKDCDVCHRQKGVKVGPMPTRYNPILPMSPKRVSINVYPDKPTSMGQCIYCHPDVDSFTPGRVIFAHAEHLRRAYACTVCHPQFGHSGEQVQRPSMQTCYQCHGLVHASNGPVAGQQCDKCHPKGFNLKPSDHTVAFVAGAHKVRANLDPSYCAMCHKPDFCVACHQGKTAAPGRESTRVVPVDHKKADWHSKHGGLYLQQKGSCASCHDSASCMACHYTPMPHPSEWLSAHGKLTKIVAASVRDCNVCHTDREKCQGCHHGKVRRAQLTVANCASGGPGLKGCHPEMAQQPPTDIKNKPFAEHAVHFAVAKKKGEPYTCDDCHVGFGTSSTHPGQADLQQGHDVRLCYGCHGALDFDNKLIAPYPGAQLCLRCHKSLNI